MSRRRSLGDEKPRHRPAPLAVMTQLGVASRAHCRWNSTTSGSKPSRVKSHDQPGDAQPRPPAAQPVLHRRLKSSSKCMPQSVATLFFFFASTGPGTVRWSIGIVELETMANFLAADEQFEAVGELRVDIVGARQGADACGWSVISLSQHTKKSKKKGIGGGSGRSFSFP